ncbi:hypothetical protein GLOIN_2v1738890 [Rhizophagus clarus]|uniref:Uncharacterized protein n=1 Tax=Rhizophagus clarus TaxID=94130 RepID=A0A8H3QKD5_9GLOM|nr:hypothetical protein GLOIN_2v1738890 [Rhizophagus clarus]
MMYSKRFLKARNLIILSRLLLAKSLLDKLKLLNINNSASLELWKVVGTKVDEQKSYLDDIKNFLGDELMTSRYFLKDYFTEEYFKDEKIMRAIHINCPPPPIHQSGALHRWIRRLSFQMWTYKVHPYYNAILNLQIPSNPRYKQRPSLLMNDLPTTNRDNGLTNTTNLEELSEIKKIVIILGTSDSGKTRTLIESLCKKYGFYLTSLTNENLGSDDLTTMIEHLLPRLKDSSVHNDAYAIRFSKCLLFARIHTLNYILENYGKKIKKFQNVFLDDEIRKSIRNIFFNVNQKRLPVILDEALIDFIISSPPLPMRMKLDHCIQ